MRTIDVCWRPGHSPDHWFVEGANSAFQKDTIDIQADTAFLFVASQACSTADAYPFTMKVNPSGDVWADAATNGSGRVRVFAAYEKVGQANPVNMHLVHGSTDFAIDSGKPIIRNDPRRSVDGAWLIAGVVVALAVAAYVLWQRRSRKAVP